VLGLAARDQRCDAERAQLAAAELVVVAAVSDQPLRSPPWGPGRPPTGGIASKVRAAAIRGDELLDERTRPYDHAAVERSLRRWPDVRCCAEAGPTGFGLYRYLVERGIACDVVAPGRSGHAAQNLLSPERHLGSEVPRETRSGSGHIMCSAAAGHLGMACRSLNRLHT